MKGIVFLVSVAVAILLLAFGLHQEMKVETLEGENRKLIHRLSEFRDRAIGVVTLDGHDHIFLWKPGLNPADAANLRIELGNWGSCQEGKLQEIWPASTGHDLVLFKMPPEWKTCDPYKVAYDGQDGKKKYLWLE